MNNYSQNLISIFEAEQNAELALGMKAYLRNQFDFYGVKAENRRYLFQIFLKKNGLPTAKDLLEIIHDLWKQPQREMQYIGMELLFKMKGKWDKDIWQLIEYMVLTKSWWDTVDYIASSIVGHYFKKYPGQIATITEKWSQSDSFWLRRTCILFQLKYKEQTNEKLLARFILQNHESKEFFLQKAIGWSLRQYAKYDPKWVLDFVNENPLKPLSEREALRIIKKNC